MSVNLLSQNITTNADIKSITNWNIGGFVVHLIVFITLIVLAEYYNYWDKNVTVTKSVPNGPPVNGRNPSNKNLFEIPLVIFPIVFEFICFVAHIFGIIKGSGMLKGIDFSTIRWIEYSISATIMLLGISIIVGITDIGALLPIIAANFSMIWFGYAYTLIGRSNPQGIFFYVVSCFVGLLPWIGIMYYGIQSAEDVKQDQPTVSNLIYAIIFAIFILFMCFTIPSILEVNKTITPLTSEKTYIFLSITAKTLLSILIFFTVKSSS